MTFRTRLPLGAVGLFGPDGAGKTSAIVKVKHSEDFSFSAMQFLRSSSFPRCWSWSALRELDPETRAQYFCQAMLDWSNYLKVQIEKIGRQKLVLIDGGPLRYLIKESLLNPSQMHIYQQAIYEVCRPNQWVLVNAPLSLCYERKHEQGKLHWSDFLLGHDEGEQSFIAAQSRVNEIFLSIVQKEGAEIISLDNEGSEQDFHRKVDSLLDHFRTLTKAASS